MSLLQLVEMSNRYGADEEFVLAGGGNTSYKAYIEKTDGWLLSNRYNSGRIAKDTNGKECSWFLRTPGTDKYNYSLFATSVSQFGHVDVQGSDNIGECGVRPALWLKL